MFVSNIRQNFCNSLTILNLKNERDKKHIFSVQCVDMMAYCSISTLCISILWAPEPQAIYIIVDEIQQTVLILYEICRGIILSSCYTLQKSL